MSVKHSDPDDQVRNERDYRQDIRPRDVTDYKYRRIDVGHQDRLKGPWIKLPFDSLDDGHN